QDFADWIRHSVSFDPYRPGGARINWLWRLIVRRNRRRIRSVRRACEDQTDGILLFVNYERAAVPLGDEPRKRGERRLDQQLVFKERRLTGAVVSYPDIEEDREHSAFGISSGSPEFARRFTDFNIHLRDITFHRANHREHRLVLIRRPEARNRCVNVVGFIRVAREFDLRKAYQRADWPIVGRFTRTRLEDQIAFINARLSQIREDVRVAEHVDLLSARPVALARAEVADRPALPGEVRIGPADTANDHFLVITNTFLILPGRLKFQTRTCQETRRRHFDEPERNTAIVIWERRRSRPIPQLITRIGDKDLNAIVAAEHSNADSVDVWRETRLQILRAQFVFDLDDALEQVVIVAPRRAAHCHRPPVPFQQVPRKPARRQRADDPGYLVGVVIAGGSAVRVFADPHQVPAQRKHQ